jgi:hypothetical protein
MAVGMAEEKAVPVFSLGAVVAEEAIVMVKVD